jgi:EAL domain-containing protein (putative c-di-GMP-specific phosphodiesterase class I)
MIDCGVDMLQGHYISKELFMHDIEIFIDEKQESLLEVI